MTPHRKSLLERFLRYQAIPTESKANGGKTVPSTKEQWNLSLLLEEELRSLGLTDVHLDEHACLTACLPQRGEGNFPSIGFCCHLDTASIGGNPAPSPQLIHYEGGNVVLNEEKRILMKIEDHPELQSYAGEDILFTDGSGVLGADDKAGITAVMDSISRFAGSTCPHGNIFLAFVPDEEVGLRGSKSLDLARFHPDFAFTLDCCGTGECSWETFYAGTVTVTFTGVPAHPMNGKGRLVNPLLPACELVHSFDPKETPEWTEGKEGYIWCRELAGTPEKAVLTIQVRDHDKNRYEEKKWRIAEAVWKMAAVYPKVNVTCSMEDSYGNIMDAMTKENGIALDFLYEAFAEADLTPRPFAMRGGTDGSYLSTKGIFTPNYFTGALNFHSIYEFLPLSGLEKAAEVTGNLILLTGKGKS